MSRSIRSSLLLALTAMIWGAAFVAQDVAMDSLPPFAFNALRLTLAALTLLCLILWMDRAMARGGAPLVLGQKALRDMTRAERAKLLRSGALCGLCLALGSGFQQLGISMGSGAGKAGFVTALYIVLVPLCGLAAHRRVGLNVWVAVCLSTLGLYLLCVKSGFALEGGDLCLILCAFSFTAHILVIDRMSGGTDCVKMSCVQFAVAALLCGGVSLFTETVTWQGVRACAVPILYAGILSGAVGYTLQIIAQRDVEPTLASLIMCLESVFAVVFGWLLIGERMSARETLGCVAMLAGILLAQLPVRRKDHARVTPAP